MFSVSICLKFQCFASADKKVWTELGVFCGVTAVCLLLIWVVYLYLTVSIVLVMGLAFIALCSYMALEILDKHWDNLDSTYEMRHRSYELARDFVYVWTGTVFAVAGCIFAIVIDMDPVFVEYACCKIEVGSAIRMWASIAVLLGFIAVTVRVMMMYDDWAEQVNQAIESGWRKEGAQAPGDGMQWWQGPPPAVNVNVNVAGALPPAGEEVDVSVNMGAPQVEPPMVMENP